MTQVSFFPGLSVSPVHREAEQAVLGICLSQPNALDRIEDLREDHFGESANRWIWRSFQDFYAKGAPLDPYEISLRLSGSAAFQEMGGREYLANLIDRAPPWTTLEHHVSTIIEYSVRRTMERATADALAALRTGSDDSAAIIERLEGDILSVTSQSTQVASVGAAGAVSDVLDFLDAPEDMSGVSTGIGLIDDHMGRIRPGDLVLLAGRSGMGKSAICGSIALHVAKQGIGVIQVSLEMSARQQMWRHISEEAFARHGSDAPTYDNIGKRKFFRGQEDMVREAASAIRNLPIHFISKGTFTLAGIRGAIRRQRVQWAAKGIELGLATVDHLGLVKAEIPGKDRYHEQTAIAIGAKRLAVDLNVPLIALAQFSRATEAREGKRPSLSDLRDSGALEENADAVIGLYRPAYYAKMKGPPKSTHPLAEDEWLKECADPQLDAIFLKLRMGRQDTIKLWCSIGHNAVRSAPPVY